MLFEKFTTVDMHNCLSVLGQLLGYFYFNIMVSQPTYLEINVVPYAVHAGSLCPITNA